MRDRTPVSVEDIQRELNKMAIELNNYLINSDIPDENVLEELRALLDKIQETERNCSKYK